jgi:hypothetical protein
MKVVIVVGSKGVPLSKVVDIAAHLVLELLVLLHFDRIIVYL